ncbi:MAG: hypothetical protein CVV11_11865 [Gammaproteobacteria bacterium HGW-Gammaproteobacteria-15]|nr:MAG: hypothetical protein CVV11_11865 [Gammaproteobacteria bacterium HGW-Gammaproteobacteria-15]
MNTLTALTLTAAFAGALLANHAMADELTDQIRGAAQQQLQELHSHNQQQARIALHKTALELLARQTAEQDAATALLAYQAVRTAAVVAE